MADETRKDEGIELDDQVLEDVAGGAATSPPPSANNNNNNNNDPADGGIGS